MKNKFTVTITDVEGSKHYNLHQIVKKFALYFSLFIIFIISFGAWFIFYLAHEVSELEAKKDDLLQKELTLSSRNKTLQKQIDTKAAEYDILQDKVETIEELVGIKPSKELSMDERLENITISNAEQEAVFKVIPNGEVVKHKGISAPYGWREHPIVKRREFHQGIDLRAPLKTPVHAPADGVVKFAAFHKNGFGYLVTLDHNFGFQTRYAHLSKNIPVKEGQFIKKGDIIGYTGNTGLSTGPHLHYEVRFLGRVLDPKNFMQWKSNNFTKIFKKETHIAWQSLIKIITNKENLQIQKPQS